MDTSGIHLHYVVTIPYILDAIVSCIMHILCNDNKVKLIELINGRVSERPGMSIYIYT